MRTLTTQWKASMRLTAARGFLWCMEPHVPPHGTACPLLLSDRQRRPNAGRKARERVAVPNRIESAIVDSCLGSALGSGSNFQAERFCCCRSPSFSAEWSASVDAAANGCQLGVRLRSIHMLQPTGTAANWPCRQQLFFNRRSGVPAIETAPTPVFRTFHQLRPQSIAFRIPAHRQKVVIVLNRKRFESPLIQMTRTSGFAMSVPALRMSQGQPADKA